MRVDPVLNKRPIEMSGFDKGVDVLVSEVFRVVLANERYELEVRKNELLAGAPGRQTD